MGMVHEGTKEKGVPGVKGRRESVQDVCDLLVLVHGKDLPHPWLRLMLRVHEVVEGEELVLKHVLPAHEAGCRARDGEERER